jgi:hypothetical protein
MIEEYESGQARSEHAKGGAQSRQICMTCAGSDITGEAAPNGA